jgi:Flp pilus assembly protein TadG
MLVCLRRFLRRLIYPQQGSVTVEFAILVPIFLLLVFGIADFGHGWYMKQIVTNASREGARYGSRYNTDASGNHLLPNALSPAISAYITSKYSSLLPGNANLTVTPGGGGYTSGNPGDDLSVAVQATKTWWVVGKLLPSLGTSQNLTSTTWMKCE